MFDFSLWAKQPINPIRMMVVTVQYVAINFWKLLFLVAPSVLILTAFVIVGRYLHLKFGVGKEPLSIAIMLAIPLFSAIVAVSVQRWVLLGEWPGNWIGLSFGWREWRIFWYLVLHVMNCAAVGVIVIFIVTSLGFAADSSGITKWMIAVAFGLMTLALMSAFQAPVAARISIGLQDSLIDLDAPNKVIRIKTPYVVQQLTQGQRVRLALTWFVYSAVLCLILYSVWFGMDFLAAHYATKRFEALAFFSVWFGGVALMSVLNALLYLRLGGETPQEEAALEATAESPLGPPPT